MANASDDSDGGYLPRWDGISPCEGGRDAKVPSGFDSTYGALLTLGYILMIGGSGLSWSILSCTRMKQSFIESKVFKIYKLRLKSWNEEREKMMVFIYYIIKKWDVDDCLKDNENPFLLDRFNPDALKKRDQDMKKSTFNINLEKKHRNSDLAWKKEIDKMNVDPRVLHALGVLQKYDYVTWESFIYDFNKYKDSGHVSFSDFSVRMQLSLRKYVQEHKVQRPSDKVWWEEHLRNIKSETQFATE